MSEKLPPGFQHPVIQNAFGHLAAGRLDRREFIRIAALLGASAASAYALVGLPAPAYAEGQLPFPPDDPKAKPGGVLKVAMQVQKLEDPATFSWVQMSNQSRHTLEYVAITGPDNITRPMLAESWAASPDLKTWTFSIRKGVMWHTGEELTADHIAWNVMRWADPAVASSNVGLSVVAGLLEDTGKKDDKGKPIMGLSKGAVEVVDKYTLRLNMNRPVLSAPEDLYNYPTAILHPSFKPPLSENMIGTGPFALAEFNVGDKCILKRVTKTKDGKDFKYWGGTVYLDEIAYYNFDGDNQLSAFASGDVHTLYDFTVEQLDLAKSLPGVINASRTAQNICCRMQVDHAPFTDKRVRQAIVMSVDNAKVKNLVYGDDGDVGEDHHVAPVHPDYGPLPPLKRDVEGAKKLLKEAGFGNGLQVTIDVGNTDGPWHQTACEAMRDQMKEAGIDLRVNVMPAAKYWEIWDKTPFGCTAWTHRPLGTMVMSLGYRTGVPWNESHYANPAFDKALDAAEATLDVAARKDKLAAAAKILQDDAVMVMPIWRPVYTIVAQNVNGYQGHPTEYHQFNKIWLS
ncbi:MAG: ABC transporter substrate-binding protein [Methylobacteriaceae bacterium]|nr:ABC transporter substrate-binding protein [Methylobacteriaceae bacterium]MBV9247282.1 ABC transporter substrate-binding protein [Methylobacteriaceae bacterium]MBV9636776.1 ABC transporter substrate-binding protein [Methylobacteriaceae bacterium]